RVGDLVVGWNVPRLPPFLSRPARSFDAAAAHGQLRLHFALHPQDRVRIAAEPHQRRLGGEGEGEEGGGSHGPFFLQRMAMSLIGGMFAVPPQGTARIVSRPAASRMRTVTSFLSGAAGTRTRKRPSSATAAGAPSTSTSAPAGAVPSTSAQRLPRSWAAAASAP